MSSPKAKVTGGNKIQWKGIKSNDQNLRGIVCNDMAGPNESRPAICLLMAFLNFGSECVVEPTSIYESLTLTTLLFVNREGTIC